MKLSAGYVRRPMATMQDCTTGITTEMMRHVTDSHIREETIKAANAELVNRHSQL